MHSRAAMEAMINQILTGLPPGTEVGRRDMLTGQRFTPAPLTAVQQQLEDAFEQGGDPQPVLAAHPGLDVNFNLPEHGGFRCCTWR